MAQKLEQYGDEKKKEDSDKNQIDFSMLTDNDWKKMVRFCVSNFQANCQQFVQIIS